MTWPVASHAVAADEVEVERVEGGAVVRVDGAVRARFVGDLDQAEDQAALDELVHELFGELS